MISIAKPELLLAALKGPELACLLALQFAEGPAKVIWLGQVTGLGEHSLTQALDKLLALGLARHDGRRSGWQLAPSLRRLLLEREKGQLSLGECMADPLPARREGNLPADRAAKRGAAGDPGLPPPPAEPTSNLTPAAKRGASKDRVPLPIPGDPAPDLPPAAKRGAAKDAELLLSPGDPVPDLPPAAKRGAAQEFDTPPAQPAGDQRLAPGGGGQGDTLTGLNRAPVAAYERHPAAAIRGGSQPSFGIDTEEIKVGGGINNLSPPALTYLTTCAAPRSDAALVGDVLAASRMLFGETVHGPPARYPDVALLLAHLAEVYNRRQTLRTPARVVYANLEKGVRPAETYCRAPLDYLPVDFLEAAGLARPARLAGAEPGRVGVAESAANTAEDAESLEEGIRLFAHSQCTPQHPSLDLPVSTGSERSAREAWSIARAALQHMIPLAVYAETVELLRLSRFESEGCVFVVAAPDPSRIEWLKQRLSRLLERALTGACAQEAKVLFVGDS